MAGNKKLNLEWIPEAYSASENVVPKKDISENRDSKYLIVRSKNKGGKKPK
ncbi:hypothetical protein ABIB50_000914 [Mucilaginibacter sp. UYCu711]